MFQPAEEPLPPGWAYLIREVGLHRALSFDPMLFFNELLVHRGIPTGSSDEAHVPRLSVVASRSNGLKRRSWLAWGGWIASCGAKTRFSWALPGVKLLYCADGRRLPDR